MTVEDIRNLLERKLVVQMPDFKATTAARNQVTYVRRAYPLPKGLDYETHTDPTNNIITIRIIGEEEKGGEV